jgi:hypothetical protein
MLMLGRFSSVEDRQRFVEGKPYQPTAESALVIKGRGMASGRAQTIFCGNYGSVRTAKHAVCDKIQQAVISRRPNVKKDLVVRRTLKDRNNFAQLQFQGHCGLPFRF